MIFPFLLFFLGGGKWEEGDGGGILFCFFSDFPKLLSKENLEGFVVLF